MNDFSVRISVKEELLNITNYVPKHFRDHAHLENLSHVGRE